ncbi:MAG: hypothetical protein ACNI3A_10825 [Desulfovibrio sp.]|uniref:hypothetical protein n=1 Tax=Desulfovibrio sp. 7SRBS1 TaxID=3378064 RepID=UPI003B3D27D5
MNDWLEGSLIPHLKQVMDKSLSKGLQLALRLTIAPQISLVNLTKDIPPDELLAALQKCCNMQSPFALLGVVEIAATHLPETGFYELVEETLNRILGEKANTWVGEVTPSLVRICLGIISVEQSMWETPPYWRHMAAVAHASIISDILGPGPADVERFISDLEKLATQEGVLTQILDMRHDPLWRAIDLSPQMLRAQILGRLLSLNEELKKNGESLPNGGLIEAAFENHKSDGSIVSIAKKWSRLFGPVGGETKVDIFMDYAA